MSDFSVGAALVDVSAWVALLLYPCGLVGAGSQLSPGTTRWARRLFAAGGAVFLAHAALAFTVHYELSHTVALKETAVQTAALTGVASGFGLYLNYLFALMWCLEIVWWFGAPAAYRSRPRWISIAIHGFFLFMILNGAVVFVAWPRRALGLLVLAFCGLALSIRVRSGKRRPASRLA